MKGCGGDSGRRGASSRRLAARSIFQKPHGPRALATPRNIIYLQQAKCTLPQVCLQTPDEQGTRQSQMRGVQNSRSHPLIVPDAALIGALLMGVRSKWKNEIPRSAMRRERPSSTVCNEAHMLRIIDGIASGHLLLPDYSCVHNDEAESSGMLHGSAPGGWRLEQRKSEGSALVPVVSRWVLVKHHRYYTKASVVVLLTACAVTCVRDTC
jgi:hypothetical protein